jgi:hypothetical protein
LRETNRWIAFLSRVQWEQTQVSVVRVFGTTGWVN